VQADAIGGDAGERMVERTNLILLISPSLATSMPASA